MGDALDGDPAFFTREDAVEAAWAVVDRVLHEHKPTIAYEPGSWGPEDAGRMTRTHGGWHTPTSGPAAPWV